MKKRELAPVTVIIAAAGGGTRMGGISKPLMKLCGRQAILYSLDLFMNCDRVEKVVISARPEEMHLIHELAARENYMKPVILAEGGSTRQESVVNAFRAAFAKGGKTKFVAIHDAARPLLTPENLERVLDTAERYGNAVCGAHAKDTFKHADKNNLVSGSVDRSTLWHIQTPQVFDTEMLHTALALAEKNASEATDESSLVSEAGFLVKLVDCGHDNLKLTYPEDVVIAEAILNMRKGNKK